jgi:aromatic-L-amino-acid decarboxylase
MPISFDQNDPANLELTPGEMREFAEAVVSRVIAHIESLPEQPASGDVAAEALCASMREPPTDDPTPFDTLLDSLFERWIPRSFTAAGPGYLAFIPGGGLFPAAVADFISDGVNRFTGVWQAAPALVQLEANALEWLREWMEFPETTRGLFTTGGSMANFNAILCARERLRPDDVRSATMYTSSQVHHSVLKSAKLAGIFPDRVREIDVDDAFRMRIDALESAVARDRRDGLRPFLVVSTAGTTNTGAVDPLPVCNAFCRREGLWHHVDGAYGAFFYAVPELRHLLSGLSEADSLTLDPHKGLFLPYGTGALLVRDGRALRAAHSLGHTVGYLPAMPDAERFYDPSSHGPDLSRGFPGLRVWLCVKIFGVEKLRAAIAEKRALALDAAARIADVPGVRMAAPPQLSLFAFYLSWPGATLEEEDAATRDLLHRVTARGRVMLTGCRAGGRFLARVCVLSFRTRQDRIDACVEDVAQVTAALVRDGAQSS